MKFLLALGFVVALFRPTKAEPAPPNQVGVSMGHIYLNVENVEVQEKFWIEQLGATPFKQVDVRGVKLPDGMLILLHKQVPVGGSEGCVLDHFGFKVPNLAAAMNGIRVAGYTVQRELKGTEGTKNAFLVGPDKLRLEFQEDPTLTLKSIGYHLHYQIAPPVPLRDWHVNTFSTGSRKRGQIDSADVPGMRLSFSPAREAGIPMKGRVIDHIGFEVKNLEAFCKSWRRPG